MTFKIVAIIAVLSAGVVLVASLIGALHALPGCCGNAADVLHQDPQECRTQCAQLVASSARTLTGLQFAVAGLTVWLCLRRRRRRRRQRKVLQGRHSADCPLHVCTCHVAKVTVSTLNLRTSM